MEIGVSAGKSSTLVCQAGKISHYLCRWQPMASDILCQLGSSRAGRAGHQVCCWGWTLGWGALGKTRGSHFCSQFVSGRSITSFYTNSSQCNVSAGSLPVLVKSGQNEELVFFLGAGQSSVKIWHCAFGPAVLQGTFPMLCPQKSSSPPCFPPSICSHTDCSWSWQHINKKM